MNKFGSVLFVVTVLGGCSRVEVPDHRAAGAVQSSLITSERAMAAIPMAVARNGKAAGFASLPDRGELIIYPPRDARSAIRDGAYTWHRVGISETHALRAMADGRLQLVTPAGESLAIEYDRHVEHASGDWSWVGHIAGHPEAQTILTFGRDAVFGTIAQTGKRSLRLTTRNGASWLVETDPSKLVGIASTGANPRKRDHLSTPKFRAPFAFAPSLSPQPAATTAVAATAATTIDVVVGYTTGFSSAQGGNSAAVTRVNHLATVTNEAYTNSQVNGRIRIVHAMSVSYTDNSTNQGTLERLTGYDVTNQTFTPPDSAFNALRSARDQYGADLVALVRQFRDPEQDGCGIAWLIGGGKSGVVNGDDYFGYAVISDGVDENEDDGQTYFCREESFAHELAHNMGSAHDRDAAEGDDGVLDDPDDYGAFDYSFGLKTSATAGNFYTIMAYGDQGQQDFRVFSNPSIMTCDGRACGTTSANNARSLNNMIPLVASFRATRVGDGQPDLRAGIIAGNFNSDDRDDILWRHSGNGQNTIWLSGYSSTQRAVTAVTNLDWQVAGTGDFNGDGRSDIFWRNRRTGQNVIWRYGSSSTQTAVTAVTDTAWQVAGIGDFNRDGRSDVLWRHANHGRNVIWFSASSQSQLAMTTVSVSWQLVGTGDFNADGRSDVVWRHSGTGDNAIWLSGNSSTQQAMTDVSALTWQVAGTGDFNGDGRADVLWRNRGTGANTIWLSGNSGTVRAVASVTDLNWRIVGTGDFNGDGRSDILWRHATLGRNAIWLSARSDVQQEIGAVTALVWQIVG
ncbi:reprolysin-like metallopeptidase [Variovorax beijingensis]|jgi:hypothetical protein|uniref:reprolysin-like metallopeptidase n=1 Tax=Variovorax beijingensis TaxID=2496117 RepID=UPI003F69A063